MTKEEAPQITENLLEQAYINASDIDEDLANEIEEASNIIELL